MIPIWAGAPTQTSWSLHVVKKIQQVMVWGLERICRWFVFQFITWQKSFSSIFSYHESKKFIQMLIQIHRNRFSISVRLVTQLTMNPKSFQKWFIFLVRQDQQETRPFIFSDYYWFDHQLTVEEHKKPIFTSKVIIPRASERRRWGPDCQVNANHLQIQILWDWIYFHRVLTLLDLDTTYGAPHTS